MLKRFSLKPSLSRGLFKLLHSFQRSVFKQ
ncbi:hypothetical protein [Listeria phage 184]